MLQHGQVERPHPIPPVSPHVRPGMLACPVLHHSEDGLGQHVPHYSEPAFLVPSPPFGLKSLGLFMPTSLFGLGGPGGGYPLHASIH